MKSVRLMFLSLTLLLGAGQIQPTLGKQLVSDVTKGGLIGTSPQIQPSTLLSNGAAPLKTIYIGDDLSFQVYHDTNAPTVGQFFPASLTSPADFGLFVRLSGNLYTPNFGNHGGSATPAFPTSQPWTIGSLGTRTGTGTTTNPWTVRATVTAGPAIGSPLQVKLKATYVNGEDFFRHDLTFKNTSASTILLDAFLGSDLTLNGDDVALPTKIGTAVGGTAYTLSCVPLTYKVLHVPVTPPNYYTATTYGSVWSQIGSGSPLNNTVDVVCEDDGAGLEWKSISLAPGDSTTVRSLTCFGDCDIASSHVGVNKDLINNTGLDANDIDIVLYGTYSTGDVGHWDGGCCGWPYWNSFTVTPAAGGNTRLHWSNPTPVVPPGGVAHVGFTVPGTDVDHIIKGIWWTLDGELTGCIDEGNVHAGFGLAPNQQIIYHNDCLLCQSIPLYFGKAHVEWFEDEVPLALLNAFAERNPMQTDTLPHAPILIAPGGQASVPAPTPPANAHWGILVYKVGTTASLDGPGVTTDWVEAPVDQWITASDVPEQFQVPNSGSLELGINRLSTGNVEFRFELERADRVELRVFDISGRILRTLPAQSLSAGKHGLLWDGKADDGRTLSPGVYFARVSLLDSKQQGAKQVVVLK